MLQTPSPFNTQSLEFVVKNGSGKTNLLDAIYYLSFCKSYFNRSDSSNATHHHKGFRINGGYLLNEKSVITTAIVRENNKKEFHFDNKEYEKLSSHIGVLPCVIITPDDTELITGASELRRKFIDIILSQTQSDYLPTLITYNNLLNQRNTLLKQAQTQPLDNILLEIISNQLMDKGNFIFEKRASFLTHFLPLVSKNYNHISNNYEAIYCCYNSQLSANNFSDLLQKSLQNDLYLQRTTSGVHKDDIEFLLGDIKFKTEASQGQRKSLLFALKISEWQWIQQHKGFPPILLLDDVFEKLDEGRMNNLLNMVANYPNAQVFITDTHKDRLEKHLSRLNKNFEIIEV
jgi:DNA replication and repair protein RecF